VNARDPGYRSAGLWFSLDIDFTPELTSDVDYMYALVTLQARHGSGPGNLAEIIVLDRSRHMHKEGRLLRAQAAARSAIAALPDGTPFAVIAGNHAAVRVYPEAGPFASAGSRSRGEAMAVITNLAADGGAALGRWLACVSELSGQAPPGAACHAVLYTSGISEESPDQLASSLKVFSRSRGFTCDVRSVGDGGSREALAFVAQELSGSVEAVPVQAAPLPRSPQQAGPAVTFLQLSLSERCRLVAVTQTEPDRSDVDLPAPARDHAGTTVDIPLPAWAAGESRAYLVKLHVDRQRPSRSDFPAAWIGMTVERGPGGAIPCADQVELAIHDLPFRGPGPVDVSATRVTDWDQLTHAAQEGLNAYRHGDTLAARRQLEHAVALARRLGAAAVLRQLERVVDIDEFGQVTLHDTALDADVREASASARQVRRGAPAGQVLVSRTCPDGHDTKGPEVNFCEEEGCRHQFPA